MTEKKIKNNMSSSGLTRRSRNKDLHVNWIPDQVGDDRKGRKDDRRVESGRSMTEMLGVLAVIGVLSVGGIAGYTYAMNKHYANELLNGASQRAVILKAQKAAALSLSLREFDGMEVAGGEFSLDVLEPDGAIGISVSKVKGAVCKNLIQATEGTDITIAKDDGETLTDITEEDCDDENDNNLVFVYRTGNGDGNSDDTGCSATQISCGGGCCPNTSECVDNQCTLDELTCVVGEDMYCRQTDDNGDCIFYDCCAYDNTGDLIVGLSNTDGLCADEENPFIYCYAAAGDGCYVYSACDHEVSFDFVEIAQQTQKEVGGDICCMENESVVCNTVYPDGSCANAGCESVNEEYDIIEDYYGDLDIVCPKNTTPYVGRFDMGDDEIYYDYGCCSSAPVLTEDGITSTCDDY